MDKPKVRFPVALKGFITLLFLMFILTLLFNWLWTGTGVSEHRTLFPSISTNYNEFKEYATLYISLLSFGAAMFAGLAIFLVFHDWKDQHNKTVFSSMAKDVFNLLNAERKILNDAKFEIDDLDALDIYNNIHLLDFIDKIFIDLASASNKHSLEIQGFMMLTMDEKAHNIYCDYREGLQEIFNRYAENKPLMMNSQVNTKLELVNCIKCLHDHNLNTMLQVKKYLII